MKINLYWVKDDNIFPGIVLKAGLWTIGYIEQVSSRWYCRCHLADMVFDASYQFYDEKSAKQHLLSSVEYWFEKCSEAKKLVNDVLIAKT